MTIHVPPEYSRVSTFLPFNCTVIPDVVELGRRYQDYARHRLHNHIHDSSRLEIVYLRKGRQTYVVDRHSYTMMGGSVLVVKPGETHGGNEIPQENGLMYWVTLRMHSGGSRFLDLPSAESKALMSAIMSMKHRFFSCPLLHRHFDAIIEHYQRLDTDPLARLRMRRHILDIVLEILDASSEDGGDSSGWQKQVTDYIAAHMDETLHIPDLAQLMNQSVTRFQRRFVTEIGFTPKEYILRQKIATARSMLDNEHMSVTQVAFDLGFSSSQHFAATFRRYTGITPRAYRSLAIRPEFQKADTTKREQLLDRFIRQAKTAPL